MEEKTKSQGCCRRVPKRASLILMLCVGTALMFAMRETPPSSMARFVKSSEPATHIRTDPHACNVSTVGLSNSSASSVFVLYHWDEETLQLIKSVAYWSQCVTHLPFGIVADLYRAKYLLLGVLGSRAGLLLIGPLIIEKCGGEWKIFVVWHIVSGLAEGGILPTMLAIIGQWCPRGEKTFMISILFAGRYSGFLSENTLDAFFIEKAYHWNILFYLFGTLGVTWCLIWHCYFTASPHVHPTISEQEKSYLREKIGPPIHYRVKKIPWRRLITSIPVWAMVVNCLGQSWGLIILSYKAPEYIKTYLKVSTKENTLMVIVRNLLMIMTSLIGGFMCDFFIKRNIVDNTTIRKIFNNFGSVGTGFFGVALTYASCNHHLANGLFIVVSCFMVLYGAGMRANSIEVAPNFSGTLTGLVMTVGDIAVKTMPLLLKMPLHKTLYDWRFYFWISLIIYFLSNICFVVAGSSEVQEWNFPQNTRKKATVTHQQQQNSTLGQPSSMFDRESDIFGRKSDFYRGRSEMHSFQSDMFSLKSEH